MESAQDTKLEEQTHEKLTKNLLRSGILRKIHPATVKISPSNC
jgi:hypothetical protein